MRHIARFAHLFGLVLMLGSILAFLIASGVAARGSVTELAVARRIISNGTTFLTLPGLTLLVTSGVTLVLAGSGMLAKRYVQVMALAVAAMAVNGVVFVLPAVRSTTGLAEASLAVGHLVPGYEQAFSRESMAGAVNIALALVAMAAGIWGAGTQRDAAPGPGATDGRSPRSPSILGHR